MKNSNTKPATDSKKTIDKASNDNNAELETDKSDKKNGLCNQITNPDTFADDGKFHKRSTDLNSASPPWKWVETKFALDNIVHFKRAVYTKALSELEQYLPQS